MNLLYADFASSTVNFGNHIIELATRQFLTKYLESVSVTEFDSFKDSLPKGDFDALLIPGCTMITPGQNKSLDEIGNLNFRSFCLAGSLWYPIREWKILVKTRPITIYRKEAKIDLSIVNKLSGIVGCRDIFTYQTVKTAGLNALYTGCPTLFLENSGVSDQGYVLFSFGRHNYHKQVHYGSKIAQKHHVIGIVHEVGEFERVKAAGWKLPLIDYFGNIELYLSYFKNATYVVTGRLHGLLPALAYGKKSFYYGTNDTRTTIINHLGLNIFPYSKIPSFLEHVSIIKNPSILEYFRGNMEAVAESIFGIQRNIKDARK
jgi:hypothetical protein